jgi:MFS family permease
VFLMLFFASAASPLYPVYQVQFRFSAATLTSVFAVYVLVLLITLLFLGSVPDYRNRHPAGPSRRRGHPTSRASLTEPGSRPVMIAGATGGRAAQS